MGQLDEAIRAHLELKRKHGASEEEVKLKEQEALGPVRRDMPAPVTDEEGDAPELLADPAAAEEADLYDEEPIYDEPVEDARTEAFHEPLDPLVDPGFEPAADFEEDAALAEDEPVEGVGPVVPMRPDRGPDDTPPRGFPAVEEEDGEDVLEETPDFLQETPEHDRLWFEQKPPRDFDFEE